MRNERRASRQASKQTNGQGEGYLIGILYLLRPFARRGWMLELRKIPHTSCEDEVQLWRMLGGGRLLFVAKEREREGASSCSSFLSANWMAGALKFVVRTLFGCRAAKRMEEEEENFRQKVDNPAHIRREA